MGNEPERRMPARRLEVDAPLTQPRFPGRTRRTEPVHEHEDQRGRQLAEPWCEEQRRGGESDDGDCADELRRMSARQRRKLERPFGDLKAERP
jgi:hypothetical protein